MGISHGSASPVEPLLLTPIGEACLRMDLTAIHEILEKAGYKDDEGIANEVSFYQFKVFYPFWKYNSRPLIHFSARKVTGNWD